MLVFDKLRSIWYGKQEMHYLRLYLAWITLIVQFFFHWHNFSVCLRNLLFIQRRIGSTTEIYWYTNGKHFTNGNCSVCNGIRRCLKYFLANFIGKFILIQRGTLKIPKKDFLRYNLIKLLFCWPKIPWWEKNPFFIHSDKKIELSFFCIINLDGFLYFVKISFSGRIFFRHTHKICAQFLQLLKFIYNFRIIFFRRKKNYREKVGCWKKVESAEMKR